LDFSFQTDFNAYKRLKRTRLGKRILSTDNDLWSTEEIVLGSRAQFHVEDAFKGMKNPHWLSFSPMYHWTDPKIRVHIFYCTTALTLTSLLRREAAQAGLKLSMDAMYNELTDVTQILNLYASDSGAGRPRAEFTLSERNPLQEKLCRIFNVDKFSR